MISYQDMRFLIPRRLGPESEPADYPDIAPFSLWLIPPAWRCARRSAILAFIARWRDERQAREEEDQATVQVLARWFERLDVAWDHGEALEEWAVRDTGDVLVVWRHGKRASERSPLVEEHSPFPLLTAWYNGALGQRWTAEREVWHAGRTMFEAGEHAAVVLSIGLSGEVERLEDLVGKLVQVYGDAMPSGTDACLDFYDALQLTQDTRRLPPYREALQDLCGSHGLMEAEIAYRAQLEGLGG